MPRRWATETRRWVYRYLCLRDGEFCQICGITETTFYSAAHSPQTTFYSLDVDHIDGDPLNNDPPNLRLLCRQCNASIAIKKKHKRESVAERERENPSTRIVKSSVGYREGSAEMQANLLFETAFRDWVQAYIEANDFIPKKEAVNAGAEVVGCNPTTAAKYLAKLTSIAGPLAEMKDMLGETIIIHRNGHKHE